MLGFLVPAFCLHQVVEAPTLPRWLSEEWRSW